MDALQHLDLAARYDRALNLGPAIAEAVRPGTRVLDAGCGIGPLSFWALQAGAGEVVAVDIGGVELAQDLAEENGFADSARFVTADLWSLDLPERRNAFDVILAMIYLNDPRRDESQSELAQLIGERYLAVGGKMVPDRVRYFARACDWPSQDRATRLSRIEGRIADLEGRYGFGFRKLTERVTGSPWKPFFPPRRADGRLDLDNGRILSDRTLCMEIDILHTGYVGPIRRGDYVVVDNVGAYTNVLNAPFIRGTPAILEHGNEGIGTVLRSGSTVSDLLRSYRYAPSI